MTKECLQCKVTIVKKRNEGKPYFSKKKYCSVSCMALAYKGMRAWNKGIHMWKDKPHPRGALGKKQSPDRIAHRVKFIIGNKWNVGRRRAIETRIKMSIAQKKRASEGRRNNYKGGVTSINHLIRNSVEYRLWRETVFKRDDFTCQECGKRGGDLNADHIKSFALFPELRFDVNNGRTLCIPCHETTPSYMNRWYTKKRP